MPRASTITEILIECGTGPQKKRRAITNLREGRTILELTGPTCWSGRGAWRAP